MCLKMKVYTLIALWTTLERNVNPNELCSNEVTILVLWKMLISKKKDRVRTNIKKECIQAAF